MSPHLIFGASSAHFVTVSPDGLASCFRRQFVCWIAGLPADETSLKLSRDGPAVPWLLYFI